jgi:hypothetical protein
MVMNAMIALTLPHGPLTKIGRQPTCDSVTCLCLEICKNAIAIHFARGGGQRSHLGMTMPAAEHSVMANTQPWVNPPVPGDLNLVANAATRQIAIATNACDRGTKACNAWIKLTNKLKQQLIDAVGDAHLKELKHETSACAWCTIAELLNHLVTACGQIKVDNIARNKKKLSADWSPDAPLEDLWNNVTNCHAFATRALANW